MKSHRSSPRHGKKQITLDILSYQFKETEAPSLSPFFAQTFSPKRNQTTDLLKKYLYTQVSREKKFFQAGRKSVPSFAYKKSVNSKPSTVKCRSLIVMTNQWPGFNESEAHFRDRRKSFDGAQYPITSKTQKFNIMCPDTFVNQHRKDQIDTERLAKVRLENQQNLKKRFKRKINVVGALTYLRRKSNTEQCESQDNSPQKISEVPKTMRGLQETNQKGFPSLAQLPGKTDGSFTTNLTWNRFCSEISPRRKLDISPNKRVKLPSPQQQSNLKISCVIKSLRLNRIKNSQSITDFINKSPLKDDLNLKQQQSNQKVQISPPKYNSLHMHKQSKNLGSLDLNSIFEQQKHKRNKNLILNEHDKTAYHRQNSETLRKTNLHMIEKLKKILTLKQKRIEQSVKVYQF